MDEGYLSSAKIMAKVGLSHKPTFRKNYLLPALKQGLIKMSHPDIRLIVPNKNISRKIVNEQCKP